MSSQVLHEEAHVPEVQGTDAALQPGVPVSRDTCVDVLIHLTLLLEQDLVSWTDHLKIIKQVYPVYSKQGIYCHELLGEAILSEKDQH